MKKALFSKSFQNFVLARQASFLLWNTPDHCPRLTPPLPQCTALPRDLAKQPLFKLGGTFGRAGWPAIIGSDDFKIICVSHDLRNVLCFVCVSDAGTQAAAATHCLSTGSGGRLRQYGQTMQAVTIRVGDNGGPPSESNIEKFTMLDCRGSCYNMCDVHLLILYLSLIVFLACVA